MVQDQGLLTSGSGDFGKIIQVTASISPGSSGSPVVNMEGEVVGVISFFLMPGQNLNFAIPGERIARLTPGEGKILSAREEAKEDERLAFAKQLYNTGRILLWAEEYVKALFYPPTQKTTAYGRG